MATPVNVLIDGASVIADVASCDVTRTAGNFCYDVSIDFKSFKYWKTCDPSRSTFGTLRIKVVIGTVTYAFFAEERSTGVEKEGISFNLWGRSKSALMDKPYAQTITDGVDDTHPWLTGDSTAEDIVTYLTSDPYIDSVTVNWDIDNFPVYANSISASNSTPIQIISQLVEAAGGEFFPEINGEVSVKEYTTEASASPATFSDVQDIVQLDEHIIYPSGFNAVTVYGYDSVEDSSISISAERTHTRYYSEGAWVERTIRGRQWHWVTVYYSHPSATIVPVFYSSSPVVFARTDTKSITETVELIWGVGHTTYPNLENNTEINGSTLIPTAYVEVTYETRVAYYKVQALYTNNSVMFYFSIGSSYTTYNFSVTSTSTEDDDPNETDDPDDPDEIVEEELAPSFSLVRPDSDPLLPGQTHYLWIYSGGPCGTIYYRLQGRLTERTTPPSHRLLYRENITFFWGKGTTTYPDTDGNTAIESGNYATPVETLPISYHVNKTIISFNNSDDEGTWYFYSKSNKNLSPTTYTFTTSVEESSLSLSIEAWTDSYGVAPTPVVWTQQKVNIYNYAPDRTLYWARNGETTLHTVGGFAAELITETVTYIYGIGNTTRPNINGETAVTLASHENIPIDTAEITYTTYMATIGLPIKYGSNIFYFFHDPTGLTATHTVMMTDDSTSSLSYLSVTAVADQTEGSSTHFVDIYSYGLNRVINYTKDGQTSMSTVNTSVTSYSEDITLIYGKGSTSMPDINGNKEVYGDKSLPISVMKDYEYEVNKATIGLSKVEGQTLRYLFYHTPAGAQVTYTYGSDQTVLDTSREFISTESVDGSDAQGASHQIYVYHYSADKKVYIVQSGYSTPSEILFSPVSITEDVTLIWGVGSTSKVDTSGDNVVLGNTSIPITVKSVTYNVLRATVTLSHSLAGHYDYLIYHNPKGSQATYSFDIGEGLSGGPQDLILNIKDYASKVSLAGATVAISSLGNYTSDANGQVPLYNVPVGSYDVKITKSGYVDSDEDDLSNEGFTVSG